MGELFGSNIGASFTGQHEVAPDANVCFFFFFFFFFCCCFFFFFVSCLTF